MEHKHKELWGEKAFRIASFNTSLYVKQISPVTKEKQDFFCPLIVLHIRSVLYTVYVYIFVTTTYIVLNVICGTFM